MQPMDHEPHISSHVQKFYVLELLNVAYICVGSLSRSQINKDLIFKQLPDGSLIRMQMEKIVAIHQLKNKLLVGNEYRN